MPGRPRQSPRGAAAIGLSSARHRRPLLPPAPRAIRGSAAPLSFVSRGRLRHSRSARGHLRSHSPYHGTSPRDGARWSARHQPSRGGYDTLNSSVLRLLLQPRSLSFAFERAFHKLDFKLARAFALIKHLINAFGDRHFDPEPGRQLARRTRGLHALGHLARLADDLVEFAPAAEFITYVTVARKGAEAGQHQIANSGQSGHRLGAPAEPDGQPAYLGQASRHQRGRAIVAQTQSVDRARGDRHHVFYRAADVNPDHVAVRVNAKAVCRRGLLRGFGPLRRPRSRDNRARLVLRDFER